MRSSRAASNWLVPNPSPSPSLSRNPDRDPGPGPGQEVTLGQGPEAILTAVQVDLDPETLLDLDPGEGEDPDLTHQIFQSDAALLHFWKKGESQGKNWSVWKMKSKYIYSF